MLKARQAAILIAVFLMIGLNGCYTKFEQAKVKLVPDDNKTVIYEDWDFSRGWYRDGIEVYNTYYDYYYAQWWDECVWCTDNAPEQVFESEPGGKIDRRDYNNMPQHPYEYSGSTMQGQQPKLDNPPPSNTDQPKVGNNDDQTKNNQDNSNEKESNDAKIKRRDRR